MNGPQLALDLKIRQLPRRPEETSAPRARVRDPETSHAAAARSESFVASHEAKIFGWLKDRPQGSTYREIATETGLEPVAVGRRIKGLRETAGVYADGERDGMQLWKVRT